MAAAFPGEGSLIQDADGSVYWYAYRTCTREMLMASDDVCGCGFFETSVNDPFRTACAWHDHAYVNRKFFEERGWNRAEVDNYFLRLMLNVCGLNLRLRLRAHLYYRVVRLVGGFYYNRHEGAYGTTG